MRSNSLLVALVGLFGLLLWTGQAQSPVGAGSSTELITEIRLLRRALEEAMLTNIRTQVTMERVRMQRDSASRAQDLSRVVSDEIADVEGHLTRAHEALHAIEGLAEKETDRQRKADLEREAAAARGESEAQKAKLQSLQQRQSECAGVLRYEQAKLAEVESALTALERQSQGR